MSQGDVLVVDDSEQYLEIITAMLESRGHSVRVAHGGHEALTLARAKPPDLVLLDIHMPDLNGFEVCRELRKTWSAPQLPVLFLSAGSDAQDKVRAFELGGVDYVTKPFQIAEVLARVEVHLQLKRLQQQSVDRASELERMNQRLRQLEVARRRVIEAVVHDLKNPLTPLLKNTEWLLREGLSSAPLGGHDETRDVLRDVHLAASHMHRMVLSLLDVARATEVALVPQLEPVALVPWLEDSLDLARLHVRSNPQRLVAQADSVAAKFDPGLIARVLQNLLENALKYSPHASPVRVTAGLGPNGGLRLTVQDQGKGIPPADRERIFDAWARLDEHDAQARVSHGLGLAFCRQAVEAHGGVIRVEAAVPTGARFVVELPPNH
jgi:two-component system, sensor histidine kinase and response regulator